MIVMEMRWYDLRSWVVANQMKIDIVGSSTMDDNGSVLLHCLVMWFCSRIVYVSCGQRDWWFDECCFLICSVIRYSCLLSVWIIAQYSAAASDQTSGCQQRLSLERLIFVVIWFVRDDVWSWLVVYIVVNVSRCAVCGVISSWWVIDKV